MAFLSNLLEVLELLIVVRVVLSWIDPYSRASFNRFIANLTEPILAPIRTFARIGPVDFSPMIAIIIIQLIRQVL